MSTKHTSGPWHVSSCYYRKTVAVETPEGPNRICEIDFNRDESEGNARLIAAAPDLLKALQILLDLAGADSLASLELEDEDRATLEAVSQLVNSLES